MVWDGHGWKVVIVVVVVVVVVVVKVSSLYRLSNSWS